MEVSVRCGVGVGVWGQECEWKYECVVGVCVSVWGRECTSGSAYVGVWECEKV